MTNVLLQKTYKARKPGVILNLPESEAKMVEHQGLGQILPDEQPEQDKPVKKTEKAASAE